MDHRWFVYNLSPSFNWSKHGYTGIFYEHILLNLLNVFADEQLKSFVWDLAKEG